MASIDPEIVTSNFLFDTTPISHLGLSTRAQNVLRRAKITTVGALVRYAVVKDLEGVKQVGLLIKDEVVSKLMSYFNQSNQRTQGIEQKVKSGLEGFDTPKPFGNDEPVGGFQSANVTDKLDNFHLAEIGLTKRAYNALRRAGISTVGGLIRYLHGHRIEEIRNIGGKSETEIRVKLNEFLEIPIETRIPEQEENFNTVEIILSDLTGKALSNWFEVIKREEREWNVILLRTEQNTLKDIGELLGVTRERVRQIERRQTEKINNYLLTISSLLDKLELKAKILWKPFSSDMNTRRAVNRLHKIMKETYPLIDKDVAKTLFTMLRQAPRGKSSDYLRRWPKLTLRVCSISPPVFAHPGVLRGYRRIVESKRNLSYEELAELILLSAKKPLHWSELSSGAERSKRKKNFNATGLYNTLLRNKNKFVRVDAGTYALAEWGVTEARYFSDIAAEILEKVGTPQSLDFLYARINEIRSTTKPSIGMMLYLNIDFYKSVDGSFGLRKWLPPRNKQTLSTPRWLIEDVKSYGRLDLARKNGYLSQEEYEKIKR